MHRTFSVCHCTLDAGKNCTKFHYPNIQMSICLNVVSLYLGLLGRKLWGVGNFHRLWPVWLPPDGILPGIFHRAWGPHPHLAGTLNTVHANHFAGWLGKGLGEIQRHFPAAARLLCWRSSAGPRLSSSELRDRLSPGNTRLLPPASTTLLAESLIVPGTAHVTGCEQEKKQPQPCYLSLCYTHTHTHHIHTLEQMAIGQASNSLTFQIATLFLLWLCSKLINVNNKIERPQIKVSSNLSGTTWGGNRDKFSKRKKKIRWAPKGSVNSKQGKGWQPQSHPNEHLFSSPLPVPGHISFNSNSNCIAFWRTKCFLQPQTTTARRLTRDVVSPYEKSRINMVCHLPLILKT